MTDNRPSVLLAFDANVRHNHLASQDLLRLESMADWEWFPCEGGGIYDTNTDPEDAARLAERLPGRDALVVCWGAPTLSAQLLDSALMEGMPGVLWGRRVGLIGCGHMGRRLIRFLGAFETEIWVHDPYLPQELPEALGFLQTSLESVLSCEVVVCLVPHTPKTEGMLGKAELSRLRPGTVFVSVSRGKVTDSAALIERLKQGDIVAGLDVFDPEPVPPDSEILQLPNVFLSPHIGSYGGPSAQQGFFTLMVDELERFFDGHETQFDLTPRAQANRTGAEP